MTIWTAMLTALFH